ncbi:MAG: flap endonuclease [Clostridia bacterium]|nr:flap endonuclease [Clostridia bacterium]
MDRILLIDGHNLLFQMFFGMPSRIPSRDGRDIRGVVGFVGGVLRLIRMISPTHAAVIFDKETHNPRCDILEDYKANRPDYSALPEDQNPFSILAEVFSALDVMGIAHIEADGCECDDIISSYAHKYGGECEVYVSSYDSDFFQLITDKVKIIRYRGDNTVICDEEYILKKFSTRPSLYADAKALFGDSSDNIGGIVGVGPKTAAKIVNAYGSVEKMLSDTAAIDNEKYRTLIEENAEKIHRNLTLIRLDGHSPLPFTKEEMLISYPMPRTTDVIIRLGL